MATATDQIIQVPTTSGRFRVFRVVGVFLGGEHQESVVELETLDLKANTQGRMCVPVDLLRWARGGYVIGEPALDNPLFGTITCGAETIGCQTHDAAVCHKRGDSVRALEVLFNMRSDAETLVRQVQRAIDAIEGERHE